MKNSKYEKRTRRGLKAKAIQKRVAEYRLVAHRSGKHIYGQLIKRQPEGDIVIVACSSKGAEISEKFAAHKKVDTAFQVGKLLAEKAKEKKIEAVAFDRCGYKYHGRIKALADGAREAGLIF